jgi:hypothetical protein
MNLLRESSVFSRFPLFQTSLFWRQLARTNSAIGHLGFSQLHSRDENTTMIHLTSCAYFESAFEGA